MDIIPINDYTVNYAYKQRTCCYAARSKYLRSSKFIWRSRLLVHVSTLTSVFINARPEKVTIDKDADWGLCRCFNFLFTFVYYGGVLL